MRKLYLAMAMMMAVLGLFSCEKSQNVTSNFEDEMNRAELIGNVGRKAALCTTCLYRLDILQRVVQVV